jgi:hypothetical protein
VTLALLLALIGSAVAALTVAVLVIDVPLPLTTLTTKDNVAVTPEANLALAHPHGRQ